MTVLERSWKAFESLHAARPDAGFDIEMAAALNNYGLCLSKLREYERAIPAFRLAAELIEPHWRWNSAVFAPLLATPLASLAGVHAELGQLPEAIRITELLVPLRRSAHAPNDLVVDAELAEALRLFAWVRAPVGRELQEALSAATEALTIYQHLAQTSPDEFEDDLRLAYSVLDALGRAEDAATVRRAMGIEGVPWRTDRPV